MVNCNGCSEDFDEDIEGMLIEDNHYCDNCYFNCDNCGRDYSNRDYYSDGICNDCHSDEVEEVSGLGDIIKSYVDDKEGMIIKSKRTFGVELEMGTNKREVLQKVQQYSNKTGFENGRDGSIKDFSNTIEVRSPILSGKKGEETLKDYMDKCAEFGMKTNESCGTHVHLGAEDFVDNKNLHLVSLQEFVENKFGGLVIESKVYEYFRSNFGNQLNDYILQAFKDDSFSMGLRLDDGRTSRVIVSNVYIGQKTYPFLVRKSTVTNAIQSDHDSAQFFIKEMIEQSTDNKYPTLPVKNLVFYANKQKSNFIKLRSLLHFYTVYNDVLFSMLNPTRQEHSEYCKKLMVSYSPTKILRLENMGELEKYWYDCKEAIGVLESKRRSGSSAPSRYHAINLHSLFSGRPSPTGTIEIRMHHGTVNSEEFIPWIALHQYILDNIENVSDSFVAKSANKSSIKTKAIDMIIVLNLPEYLVEYVKKSLKVNSGISL